MQQARAHPKEKLRVNCNSATIHSIVVLLGAIALLAGFWAVTSDLWSRLPQAQGAALRRWFRVWAIKGLAAPFAIWLIFNSGLSERFPPLMLDIQAAPPGIETYMKFIDAAGIGLFVIATYWAAMTAAWVLAVLEAKVEKRAEFRSTAGIWSLLLVPVAALIIYGFGWAFAGIAATVWLLPIVQQTVPLAFPEKTKPLYSRAIAKLQSDKYTEAEAAVLQELEKSEDDFNGWLMLATLYANHFGDLAGAERIIRDTCALATTTASDVCVALNQLADWHLKLADNPVAARKALEEICCLYPDTLMERMARLKIRQLPATREDMLERKKPRRVQLPALAARLEIDAAPAAPIEDRAQAAARANECVARLNKDADNIAVREELARILAEQLGKVDLAIEQIELLLQMPNPPPAKAAEWMGLLAAWQIKYKGDSVTGRRALERLIRRYPQSSQAFAAQRRLSMMNLEEKLRAARETAATAKTSPLRVSQL